MLFAAALTASALFAAADARPDRLAPAAVRDTLIVELIESAEIQAVRQEMISVPTGIEGELLITDLVAEGALVAPGDFLLQFDGAALQEDLRLKRDEAASLAADLERARAQQELALANLENTQRIAELNREQAALRLEQAAFESEARREQARLQLKQAELALRTAAEEIIAQRVVQAGLLLKAEMALEKAQTEVGSLTAKVAALRVTAPAAGMVVYQDVGSWNAVERLRRGYRARSGQALLAIPDLGAMQAVVRLNEIDRAQVRPGQPARIHLEAYPQVDLAGRVLEVAELSTPVEENATFKAFATVVEILDADARLKPGMTAQVRIEVARHPDLVLVPAGCVQELDGQPVVIDRGGRLHPVEPGPRNDAWMAVTGIEPGLEILWQDPKHRTRALGAAEEGE